MSLTSFLDDNTDVRARFLAQFKKPEFRIRAPLLAPSPSRHSGVAGTAFDYLLRFYLEKLNPCSKANGWIAESALAKLCANSGYETRTNAGRLFQQAKDRHSRFLRSLRQKPPRDLIESAIYLARLDVLFRADKVDRYLFKRPPKALVDDLERMLALVDAEDFLAKKRCLLNPTFGLGTVLVDGADADLVIGDTLIDVKTTKHLVFDREVFNQLLGYYVLACIGGVAGWPRPRIRNLAVYYARYGLLHRIPVAKCFSTETMEAFLQWFIRRTGRQSSSRQSRQSRAR